MSREIQQSNKAPRHHNDNFESDKRFIETVAELRSLKYTLWGVGGLVLVQGGCQLLYANWKWPYVVCHDFKLSFFDFIKMGINQSLNRLKYYGK